ncbi:carboxymuconolactone decarboxylase family protein [Denitromonas iodatirespirans]|uniref:Carboxymuconolactone decarboxylase family protein n=1 Tax=Denitromonas iodatirespirans TaxID=2795389 RepID=A0A944HA66_DENI1|nr:carboxymuconolactone decarboxylase family protein [Denitromonas iodatirespirans]MBT0963969.1 carboxymuconolactone decarboxylase family protein [Denitromonas iodatirespirans]
MTATIPQGFGPNTAERLPMPPLETLDAAQRAAAQALIDGPRGAVIGPFIPLLRSPVLMTRLGEVGAALRFDSVLPKAVGEFVMAAVARHTGNQFEWLAHAPQAIAAGVPAAAIEALGQGARPSGLEAAHALAYDFASEVLHHHGVCDATYAAALACWGEQGVVELTALIGYFSTVCWVMNVARTPAPAAAGVAPLMALPG